MHHANPLHRAALALARRSIAVFPCKPGLKEPATKHGFKEATTDLGIVDGWWSGWPEQNIGLATGTRSRLVVIDIDGDKGGETTLAKLEATHGRLPPTVEAITGSGRHLYFRVEGSLPCSVNRIGPGIDTRGDGGYVLAPPSLHPCGRHYAWSVDTARQPAPVPNWVRHALAPHEGRSGKAAKRTLEEWHGLLTEPIPDGQRDVTLASIAGKLLAHNLGPVLTADLLACVNAARCDPPLPPTDVARIIRSIASRHGRKIAT